MSDFRKLRRYLAFPTRNAARIRRDVNDELQFHMDMRVEELVQAGMSRSDARVQAQRQFGDLDDATHYCVDVDRSAERGHEPRPPHSQARTRLHRRNRHDTCTRCRREHCGVRRAGHLCHSAIALSRA